MITYPNCKINIGLYVMRKRPDGYHDLETLFYPMPLCDVLEIEPSSELRFEQTGIAIGGNPEDNLCMKAYRLMAAHLPIGNVSMRLEKRIPFGAGLGGGSADAAFVLKMLNQLFQLQLDTPTLQRYAAQLGADCAFFIEDRPAFAQGIGDVLTPFDLDLSAYDIRLEFPGDAVSTREAYQGVQVRNCDRSGLLENLKLPVEQWKDCIGNDFEASVFPLHPKIAAAKQKLYEDGALYAAMSGSGSAVFGIFKK